MEKEEDVQRNTLIRKSDANKNVEYKKATIRQIAVIVAFILFYLSELFVMIWGRRSLFCKQHHDLVASVDECGHFFRI